jgi:hypothetical protein
MKCRSLAFVVFLALTYFSSAQPADTLRVLFIGNSFTYVNDLPGNFLALATGAHKHVIVDSHTIGGVSVGDTI